nr:putative ribonuclease H-like domain-containing protein [Tanacetum cinerariifolium]
MENKPNVAAFGPAWLFDIDSLTHTIDYLPVTAENQTNTHAGLQDTEKAGEEGTHTYVLFPVLFDGFTDSQINKKDVLVDGKKHDDNIQKSMSPDNHSSSSGAQTRNLEKAGEEGTHTYVLFPVLFDGFTDSQINKKDVLVDGKKHDDNIQKSMSPDNHSSSSGAQTRNLGDKTENKDKGKSLVVTITRFRDLNEDTYDFSAAGPSNTAASPPVENSALQNVSTSSHDADMPNLEDYHHSNDVDDVGAEADINNLESTISVSPIPTSRIHKDHPTSQIIGDLSSTTQTRSMAKAIKDQGFEDPKYPDKVYKVVKALYGLHQAPRAWYETLATYLLENRFQRGTIDQTLFIKKQQKDILMVQIYVDDIIFEKPLLKDSDGEDVDVHTYRVFNSPMLHMLRVEMVINSPWMLSKN